MDTEIRNFDDLIAIVRRRRYSILVPALGIFFLAGVVALALPPAYRSTSTILIEDQEVPRDYVTTTVTGYAEQRLHSINQRIMSTPKLLEIINRFNLYADLRKTRTTEEIVDRMRKEIKFETVSADVLDPRTGRPMPATIAFTLSYEGKSPATVQKIANVLASLYLEENLRVREQQTRGTSRFLEDEMKGVQGELARLDAQIAAYKQRNVDALPELAQANFQSFDLTERDVSQLNEQLKTLRERESNLQSQLASVNPEEMTADKARLVELRAKLVNLRTRVSDEYPDVAKLKAEIASLERQMKTSGGTLAGRSDNPAYISLSAQLSGVQAEIDGVKRQLNLLESRKKGLRRRIEASPRVEEGYKSLLVERNNLQAKYDDLTKKFMEARVAHGLEREQKGERFTVIDAARLPEKPVSPNVPAILLIGLFLGIGAGVGTASLREHGDQAVRNADLLSRSLRLPVLAAIPEIVNMADLERMKSRRRLLLAGTTAGAFAALAGFHFLIMDLDIFWAKVVRRLML